MARQEVEEKNRIYGYIAQSLANQYATIYYVDVYTENFTEFASSDMYKNLNVPTSGENFFETSRYNIMRVIHPDDAGAVMEIMDRDKMTDTINEQNSVLTHWIQLRQGELSLHIETFALQDLFDMVARSRPCWWIPITC